VPRRHFQPAHAGAALLAALLVLLPLWRGGVGEAAELLAALAALLAALLASHGAGRAPWAGLLLLAPVAVSLLQLLPLPGGFLSLDPPSTGRGLATLALGWGGLTAAWHLGGGRRRRDQVLLGLACSGLVVAGLAMGLALLGLEPLLAPARPFPNSNQQGGYAALTALVILGLALRERGAARALWLLGFAVVAAAVFLSLSRGAMGAFLGGVGLFAVLAARRPADAGEAPHRARLVLSGGVALALGVAAYLALDQVLSELRTLRALDDGGKAALWRPALQLLADHPLLGIGRGAFATAFAAYKTGAEQVTFTHLENDWLQPLLDFGAPAGLLTVGTLAWLWLRAARRRDLAWPEVGLLAGTAALAAQGAVDFSLQRPAASLAFAVALGLMQRGEWGFALRPAWRLGTAGALAVAALGGLLLWRAHPLDGDAAWVAAASEPAEAEARARAVERWHPADWLPAALVGGRWVEAGRCAPAMPWLLTAMQRNPTAPEPHLHAARCLAASGQVPLARREYRLAYLFGRWEALAEAARRWPTAEAMREVAPDSGEGLFAGAAALRQAGQPAEADALLRRALEEYGAVQALPTLAASALRDGDAAGALELARRAQASTPSDAEGWRLAAAALRALGRGEEADAELGRGLARLPGAPPLVDAQIVQAMASRRYSEARRLAETLAARTPAEQAHRQAVVAATLAAQGRLGEAIEHARSAAAAQPDAAWPLEAVASYCTQAGRLDDALAALEHAASRPGQAPAAWQPRLEALRRARDEAAERRKAELILRGP